jgi:hypothetical protein
LEPNSDRTQPWSDVLDQKPGHMRGAEAGTTQARTPAEVGLTTVQVRSGREAEGLRELHFVIQRFNLDDASATNLRRIFDDALSTSHLDGGNSLLK